MKAIHKKDDEWVKDYNLNKQETKELEYFQKLQVKAQEISALNLELGKLRAEIDHLNHILKGKITEELISRYGGLVTKKNSLVKFCKCMNALIFLKASANQQTPESSDNSHNLE